MFGDNNNDFLEQKRREKGTRRGGKQARPAAKAAIGSTVKDATRPAAGTAKAGAGTNKKAGAQGTRGAVGKAGASIAKKTAFITGTIVVVLVALSWVFDWPTILGGGHSSGSHITAGDSAQSGSSDSSNSDSYSYSSTFAYPKTASLAQDTVWEFDLDGQRCICAVLDVDIAEGKDGTMIGGVVESPDTYQAISYDIGSYYTLDTSFTEANEVAMKSGYYCKGTAIVLAKLIAANDNGYTIQVYKEDYSSIPISVAPSQVKKTSKEEVADAIVRLGTENADVKASIDWYNSIYPSYSSSSSSSYSSAT